MENIYLDIFVCYYLSSITMGTVIILNEFGLIPVLFTIFLIF